ncbi:MAG: hypothetical protein Hyperionvirus6_1 [Hyperionvirus sp.]|uniref:Uncharacterized protein n=1 Tax=Hyperionvirus sp. TaxID=2487770 RepID=A0A3G5A7R8_9VIRU|nr:MAG: hypothetical protein Hyperionvirus6_1 [Hyperionvirus sp.]
MSQIGKLVIFYITVVVVLIAGSIVGARYSTYREVTCIKNSDCRTFVWDKGSLTFHNCVTIKDYANKESILQLETTSPSLKTPNQKCYTDGETVTLNNPYNVMIYTFVGIGIFVFLLLLINKCCCPRNDNFKETYACINILLYITIAVVLVLYITALSIVFFDHDLAFRPVSCTAYYSEGIYNSVTHVQWNDSFGGRGTAKMKYSFQPSVLPRPCWLWDVNVSFYDPSSIYVALTIIAGSLIGICSLWLLSRYLTMHYDITWEPLFVLRAPVFVLRQKGEVYEQLMGQPGQNA